MALDFTLSVKVRWGLAPEIHARAELGVNPSREERKAPQNQLHARHFEITVLRYFA